MISTNNTDIDLEDFANSMRTAVAAYQNQAKRRISAANAPAYVNPGCVPVTDDQIDALYAQEMSA